MLSSPNFWMGFAGLFFLVAGVFILRKEIVAARGWDRLITLAPVFIGVSLAVFAPEPSASTENARQGSRPVWFEGGWRDTAVWARLDLPADAGPTIGKDALRRRAPQQQHAVAVKKGDCGEDRERERVIHQTFSAK